MKRLAVALSSLLLASVLTACSGGGGATALTADNFFREVVKAHEAAGTSVMAMTFAQEGNEITVEGKSRAGKDGEAPSFDTVLDAGNGQPVHMIHADGLLYMSLGELSQGKFFVVDPKDEGNPFANQFDSFVEQGDPAEQLRRMEGAVVDLKNLGSSDDVPKTATTKYELTVDLGKFTDEFGPDAEGKTLTYFAWVDKENRLRRLTTTTEESDIEIVWSRWGEDLEIVAPDKSEILGDVSGLVDEMRKSAS